MGQRRMMSLDIIDTDAFLDMPASSQLLYFHLNARADDDGFVANPKKVVRMLSAGTDDFKMLLAKKFLIAFEDGVCVIKHWRINNFIRKDIYKETKYLDLKSVLFIRPNGAYTQTDDGRSVAIPKGHFKLEDVNDSLTSRTLRLGKVSKGKVRLDKDKTAPRKRVATPSKENDNEPMDLELFLKWCRESKQRHINLIAEYADERQIKYTTKGQWRSFIKRNVRPAKQLAPYNDEQINKAMTALSKEKKENGGYISKWTLETLIKFLDE